MYTIKYKLTPWPRGGIYVSRFHQTIFEERKHNTMTDDKYIRKTAREEAEEIRKTNSLEKCEVVSITETLIRNVPLE